MKNQITRLRYFWDSCLSRYLFNGKTKKLVVKIKIRFTVHTDLDDTYQRTSIRGNCCKESLSVGGGTGLCSLSVLEEVDVEVDRAVEGGQQMAETGHIGQPTGPAQLRLNKETQVVSGDLR